MYTPGIKGSYTDKAVYMYVEFVVLYFLGGKYGPIFVPTAKCRQHRERWVCQCQHTIQRKDNVAYCHVLHNVKHRKGMIVYVHPPYFSGRLKQTVYYLLCMPCLSFVVVPCATHAVMRRRHLISVYSVETCKTVKTHHLLLI